MSKNGRVIVVPHPRAVPKSIYDLNGIAERLAEEHGVTVVVDEADSFGQYRRQDMLRGIPFGPFPFISNEGRHHVFDLLYGKPGAYEEPVLKGTELARVRAATEDGRSGILQMITAPVMPKGFVFR